MASDAQSWNAYAYALNNPTTRTDPSGLYVCTGSKEECQAISNALNTVQQAESKLKAGSQEQQKLESVLNFYGKEGVKNGVSARFGDLQGKMEADTSTFSLFGHLTHTTITFDLGEMQKTLGTGAGVNEQVEFGAIAAHEGQHGLDRWANGVPRTFDQFDQTERNAFTTQSYVNRALGTRSAYPIWDPTWNPALAEPRSKARIAVQAQRAAVCDMTGRCE